MTSRYAVYLAPPPNSALWAFGSSVIGYDAESGAVLPYQGVAACTASEWRALTAEPRRYGFHGTLRAPFELAEGSTEEDLLAAARAFASGQRPFEVPRLQVSVLGEFVALVPALPSGPLDRLAADTVRAFEPLRGPLAPADRERRLAARLSRRQVRNLNRWGYPFVFDDFRFHMTLTGPLPDPLREPVRASLQRRHDALDPGLPVDFIAVVRQQDRAYPFRVLARLPFAVGTGITHASPGTPRPEGP